MLSASEARPASLNSLRGWQGFGIIRSTSIQKTESYFVGIYAASSFIQNILTHSTRYLLCRGTCTHANYYWFVCRGRESNSHALRRRVLNPLRLPIPPPRHNSQISIYF